MEWITISIQTETIYAFMKTEDFTEKWKDVTMYVRLYGGTVFENNFDFKKRENASAFVKHFVREYIV